MQSGSKVGLQFIAEGLAAEGNQVHYISTASSPLDLFLRTRRERFELGWLKRCDIFPREIKKNLWEHVLLSPFPANKLFWFSPQQIKLYTALIPKSLVSSKFDLCIHDTSPAFIFSESIKCKKNILRLSDNPEGFNFQIHNILIRRFISRIEAGMYDEIWPVSFLLERYAVEKNRSAKVLTISNGVDLVRFKPDPSIHRNPKTAVFVGSIERWFDLKLLNEIAKILPDWSIDIYGRASIPVDVTMPNLRYCGIVNHELLPALLNQYSVGLIPFVDGCELIKNMDRPLKFYEYLAMGLGIAATKVGALKNGMGKWAEYGNTPEEFAQAIIDAGKKLDTLMPERLKFLTPYSWESIMKIVTQRIEYIMNIL